MRKRLVIGAIAVVVLGIAAWLWLSGTGTIGGLERKYSDAFYGRQWHENLRAKLEVFFGYTPRRDARFNRDNKRLDSCEKQLIKLGHFEERTFVLSTSSAQVMSKIMADWCKIGVTVRARGPASVNAGMIMAKPDQGRTEFVTLREFDGYAIIVLAARRDMLQWEERIRRADRR